MFHDLVTELQELLPDFGNILAIDGKAIESHGNSRAEDADDSPDGRRSECGLGRQDLPGEVCRRYGLVQESILVWLSTAPDCGCNLRTSGGIRASQGLGS